MGGDLNVLSNHLCTFCSVAMKNSQYLKCCQPLVALSFSVGCKHTILCAFNSVVVSS